MNLNMTIVQAACRLWCRYAQSRLAASCVCWTVPIFGVNQAKQLVPVRVWNALDQWCNWPGGRGKNRPLWQAKYKSQAPTQLAYWCLLFFWFSVVCYTLKIFAFSEYFPVISGFNIAVHIRSNILRKSLGFMLNSAAFSYIRISYVSSIIDIARTVFTKAKFAWPPYQKTSILGYLHT